MAELSRFARFLGFVSFLAERVAARVALFRDGCWKGLPELLASKRSATPSFNSSTMFDRGLY